MATQKESGGASIALKVIGELQRTVQMNVGILLFSGTWVKSERKQLENQSILQMPQNNSVCICVSILACVLGTEMRRKLGYVDDTETQKTW